MTTPQSVSPGSATSPIGQSDVAMLEHLADSMGFGRTHDMLRRVIAACPYLTGGVAQTVNVRIEARPADDSQEWTEIFPSQLEWMAKQGHQVRGFDLPSQGAGNGEAVKLADRIDATKRSWLPMAGHVVNVTFTLGEAEMMSAALRAAPQPTTAGYGSWQPIETAPKSRSVGHVRLFGDGEGIHQCEYIGIWSPGEEAWREAYSNRHVWPTHWMPCRSPSLPSTQRATPECPHVKPPANLSEPCQICGALGPWFDSGDCAHPSTDGKSP